jgi:hypothetical protein
MADPEAESESTNEAHRIRQRDVKCQCRSSL